MNYEEAVAQIESTQRFGSRPGLERIRALLTRLGNPQEKLRFIHVAGTNGKGTTSTLIASVLAKAGYRTGLFLSPHVCDFRERMQIDGEMIPRNELVSLVEEVFPTAEELTARGGIITEFELITAIALLWFSRKQCDAVVLEVGLGGRFDATNVIETPVVSVITSISYDHMQILGDTLGKIAFEKCGIIKPDGITVCYPQQPPEALAVIRRVAAERDNRLVIASGNEAKVLSESIFGTELQAGDVRIHLPFPGEHQVQNARTALAALNVLREEGWKIPGAALRQGFAVARIPARLEVLSHSPLVLLDGAHNPDGAKALAASLRAYLPGRQIAAVTGMLADKNVTDSVAAFHGLFSVAATVAPDSPRAMEQGKLAEVWRQNGTAASAQPNCRSALAYALAHLPPDGVLVIFGSLYLAGDMREEVLRRLGSAAEVPAPQNSSVISENSY